MDTPRDFELKLADIKLVCLRHGIFEYLSSESPFHQFVTHAFKGVKDNYGVYVIRRQVDRQVIYIGKGGTIKTSGKFGQQDIPGRLKAERSKGMTSDFWFGQLCDDFGALTIEYFVLDVFLSPGYVEAMLLQAFRNDFGKLPAQNNSL